MAGGVCEPHATNLSNWLNTNAVSSPGKLIGYRDECGIHDIDINLILNGFIINMYTQTRAR